MTEAKTTTGRTVRVWDIPVRVFHWLLVALVFTSWLTSELGGNAMTYHMWSGYTILALLIFRIVWGVTGSEHVRFGDFVHGPASVLRYLRATFSPDAPRYIGHNPLGGWSVVLMLISLLVQACTGLFASDDIATEGPLTSKVSGATSSLLTTIHRYNIYVLLGLITVHIAAALFYLFVKRENLIAAMFTGRKLVPEDADARDARMASPWLAAAILMAAGGVVAYVVN